MKGHKSASPDGMPYKLEMQKKGISLGDTAFKTTPMKANPVTHTSPGLGGRDCPHPFLHGKPKI